MSEPIEHKFFKQPIDTSKDTVLVSDDKMFYTIEGEGEHVGKRSVFFRLAKCNLTCRGFKSEASPHGCDSYVSWSVVNKMTFDQLFELLELDSPETHGPMVDHLRWGAILKLTGGEPLLQQKQLARFVHAFIVKYGFLPKIDFETNATLMPDEYWQLVNATFTTSPKMANNGDPEEKRYKADVLNYHRQIGSGFKFVIDVSQPIGPQEDEVFGKYINMFNIPLDRVWLMPCCGSRLEHSAVAKDVAELAKKHGVNFSPRLQLVLWDRALKV